MKRMFCILAATIILSLFMTGCGERGKIGNGENGTITDNNSNTTERQTDNNNNVDNGDNNGNSDNNNDMFGVTEDPTDNNTGVDNSTDYTEQNTDGSTQQGIAGRVGDAIDEGVAGLGDALTGDNNNNNNNNTQPMQ
ncbi:MAG: hypothetical protein UE295_01740 [Acutalibacteraceae bacterium]|nr:hypothetical protein [Acutalibacteraceae bacterium]